MKPGNFIQSFFGWVLLVLFTFSITPRQILHDVVAVHTDQSTKNSGGTFISKPGYDCDRLNLVAESPFTEADKFVENIPAQPCTDFIIYPDHKIVPQSITLPGLRGPPSI